MPELSENYLLIAFSSQTFRGSRWNQGTTGRFTMNLGVYFPGVAQLSWLPMPANKNRPSTHDCLLETRIGALTPNHQDYWWEIKPSSNHNLHEII
jgi:hypothetical protein